MNLSILVVSRTAARLTSMLESVSVATDLPTQEVEILCSWNGEKEAEKEIVNSSGYEFFIAQRDPYHFARNVNKLASNAKGKILALINDDVVLDPGSLDAAIDCILNKGPKTLVGALLRTPDGTLQHTGFAFDQEHNPYHILEGEVDAAYIDNKQPPFEVPAVTAAVALVQRDIYLKLGLNEEFERCGEDVQFSLDLRQNLNGHVLLCPQLSGIHMESATRVETGESGNTSNDQIKMQCRRRVFLEESSKDQLLVDLSMANREHQLSRSEFVNNIRIDRDHWEREAHLLRLEILKLQETLDRKVGS